MSERADSDLPEPSRGQSTGFDDIRVEKYKRTRYWAVWVGDRLLAVTVYKKGAVTLKETLRPIRHGAPGAPDGSW